MKITISFLLVAAIVSCNDINTTDEGSDVQLYRNMFGLLTKSGLFSELVDFATPIYYKYKNDTLSDIAAEACAYIAQSYVYMDRYDSVAYYVDCLDEFRNLKADDIKWNYMVNNVSALWSIKMYGDYDNAMSFYLKSLHDVDSADDKRLESVVLSNIVSLYRALKNPEGLPYAERAYKVGETIGEKYYMAVGAYCLSSMLYFHGDFHEAMQYASEAIEIADKNNMDYLLAECYLIYGDICVRLFDFTEAEKYYNKAMQYSIDEVQSLYIKTCLSYGKMYNIQKEYEKSLKYLKAGLDKSDVTGERECCTELLKEISVSYSRLDMKDSAALYYNRYKLLKNNKKFIVEEQEFDIVMMQYYTDEIDKRNAKLEKARMNNIILSITVVMICAVAILIYCFYRYRTRMYSLLVQQYNRFLANQSTNKDGCLGSEKEKELWEQVEALMQKDKLYLRNDVSLTKISELLNTNRTYISRVINKYSGLSFYDYINQYRIKQAVAQLSDPTVDIPLKALSNDLGFNSNSVFYRAFVKETGVPPSCFKEEALKRRKQPNSQ